jgi:integrase
MASVRQISSQVEKHGESEAAWLCFWRSPDGKQHSKSFGKGTSGKRAASSFAKTVEAELHLRTYARKSETTWDSFYSEYVGSVVSRLGASHAETTLRSLAPFVRIAKPRRMSSIDTRMIDAFIAVRRTERGREVGSSLSPAALHKDLRYLRAALRIARDWGLITTLPKFRFPRVPDTVKPWISVSDFGLIYEHCDVPDLPVLPNVSTGDWWRAFVVTMFMTGWRVSQVRAIRWSNIDLESGTILSPQSANKGRRDDFIPLHPVIREHIERIRGTFSDLLFPFVDAGGIKQSPTVQLRRFQDIQRAAGIVPRLKRPGLWYAFHDFRRGFATANAGEMDVFELQRLMQHQSITTTQRYVAMAGRLQRPVDRLVVPDVLKRDPANG